jgi:outer membrane protein assembly factor BamB
MQQRPCSAPTARRPSSTATTTTRFSTWGSCLCHDARTGEEIYGRQRVAPGHWFIASPWGYNGKVFSLSEAGDTFVIDAGPEFNILGVNQLDEMSPAIARGSLFVRTRSKLYRITSEAP